jgi:hypothetical protein
LFSAPSLLKASFRRLLRITFGDPLRGCFKSEKNTFD